jgi:transcription elongation GreA/GreB family factor
MEVNDQLLNTIEETLVAISEKDQGAVAKLQAILSGCENGNMPNNLKALLSENLELLITAANDTIAGTPFANLVETLADCGVDGMPLRDALAALGRQVFSEYPDPAGMIRAIAVLNENMDIMTVRTRWAAFGGLAEGVYAWHGAFGLGQVVEIDAFSDLVYIQFDRKQNFTLEQTLSSVSIARPDSLAGQLAGNRKVEYKPALAPDEFDIEIANSFVPPLKGVTGTVEQLLVPGCMSKKAYDDWRKGARGSLAKKQKKRTWNEARSLQELKGCLEGVKKIKPNEEEAAHLAKLFNFAATRNTLIAEFANNLATVWSLSQDVDWLEEMIRALPEDTLIWSAIEEFSPVTQNLPAKLMPFWLQATYVARGIEWLIEATMAMPLRFYDPLDVVLQDRDHDADVLFRSSHEHVKRKDSLPDTLVWLWKRHRDKCMESFGTPRPIFRSLATPAKGEYIKAKKELHRLLMNDAEFQTALMDGGSREGISRLVQMVKHAHLLNKGEKQSLLVKVVRQFPDSKDLVEDRKPVEAAVQKKITSYRTMELYRQELVDIINKKIPENSAAIAHAREYGDLRENAEFKAAKENQRLLLERRGYLESELNEVLPTDFADVVVDEIVVPGTSVVLDVDGSPLTYHILGLWDSEPENGIISYDTDIAKALISRKRGDEVELPQGQTAVITKVNKLPAEIKAWVQIESGATAKVAK